MKYIRSKNSITVINDGVPFTLTSDAPNFGKLVQAVLDNDKAAVASIVNAADDLKTRLATYGEVEVFGGHVKFRGEDIHNYLVDVILGNEDPEPVAHFLSNVMLNPDPRARADLYKWVEKARMPLTRDGCITGYKLIREDYMDHYSRTFDHHPGKIPAMRRQDCDPDPNNTCSRGLHFCSAEYLPHYGSSNSRVVLVKVNPADVVAFPTDYNLSKARCCRYEVLEEIDRSKLLPQGYSYYGDEPEELVFLRDTRDGDYVVPEGDSYIYQPTTTAPITRSEAEDLINRFGPEYWEIVPEDENDDWSVD